MKKTVGLGIILVIAGIIGLIATIDGDILKLGTTPYHEGATALAEGVDVIDIKASTMDIEVVQGESDQIVVVLEGTVSKKLKDKVRLDMQQTGNRLTIEPSASMGFTIGFNIFNVKATVKLPAKAAGWEEIKATSTTGNIRLEKAAARQISLQTTTGDVKVLDYEAERLSFKATTGNVRLESGTGEVEGQSSTGNIRLIGRQIDKPVRLASTTGNVRLDAVQLRSDVDIRSTTGNAAVHLTERPQSLAVAFNSKTGDGKLGWDDFNAQSGSKEDAIAGAYGDGAAARLSVQTTTGNFRLNK